MQTLRKRNSPCKFKNEPTRFLGEGVSFKAKLIGILEVSEARGDRMCQAALADLKMAIRAAGEHKQRITVQISIDGLRLRDEKTGDCQYHHPVHKISFIAQDMSDSRAFGYIFGSPDMGHRFFGIKTDKAASQVVIAMRDLFQVVFELKKKEIELAKQHIEQNTMKFHSPGIFVDPSPDTKGAAGSETSHHRTNSEIEKSIGRKHESQSGVVADLLDLQFELNSLQQGIHQMDKITPDNPRPTEDPFDADPFGDSFANMKVKENVQPILPPPPSSRRGHFERQQTVQPTSTSSSSSPITTVTSKTPPPYGSVHWFDKETEDLFNDGELSSLSRNLTGDKDKESDSSTPQSYYASQQVDVFTELDPLGTGLIKPYVDKKDFFQHLKNPPKKVLKDLATTSSNDTFPTDFKISNISDTIEPLKLQNNASNSDNFDDNSFANFEKFNDSDTNPRTSSPLLKRESSPRNNYQPLSVSLPPEEDGQKNHSGSTLNSSVLTKMDRDSTESTQGLIKLPSPRKYLQYSRKDYGVDLSGSKTQSTDKPFPIDFSGTSDSPASPMKSGSSDANSRLSGSSVEMDNVPEPPPRGSGSILINPPPLPPKKQSARGAIKPPPRPPYSEGHFHYDFLEREEGSPSPTRKNKNRSPARDMKSQFDDNFSPPMPQLPKRSEQTGFSESSFEDSFSSIIPPSLSSLFQNSNANKTSSTEIKKPKPSLDITLSQLTSSNLSELATSLNMTVTELTCLTLHQLTTCLAELSSKEAKMSQKASTPVTEKEPPKPQTSAKMVETAFVSNEPLFKANFDQEPKTSDSAYDKYAVFRELLETETIPSENRNELVKNDSESMEPDVQEESRPPEEKDVEEKNKMENIVSLKNLTVKLPPVSESSVKNESTPDEEEMRSDFPDTKIESVITDREEDKVEGKRLARDSSNDSEDGTEQEDQVQESDEVVRDSKCKISEKKETSLCETEPLPEKVEIKQSTSTSSDRYAALREIIEETEQTSMMNETESTNFISSPLKTSPIRTSPLKTSPIKSSPVTTSKSSAEVDLMLLFSDTLPQPSIKPSLKKEEAKMMDIFEEIKMLNVETPSAISKPITGFEDVFCPLPESKPGKENARDEENWAKFEANVFQSEKSYGESHGSVGGTSPWSPDGKEFIKEPQIRSGIQRNSGESDNEWKDEEESEESNGRYRGEGGPYGRPPFATGFEERFYYEEGMEPGDKDRSFRDKMGRKTRGGVPWAKPGHRTRDPTPWHEDARWEEERKRYLHRKIPYKDEEEYKAYWKCRPKQRPWNGDREGFWPHDDPYYEEEHGKRRLMLWSEERESRESRDSREGRESREGRDRFSSQESMGYDDEERWTRREYERRRWEEDGTFWNRRAPDGDYPHKEVFRKHDPHYARETRHYDYPPGWEEEYGPERADDSPRYVSRKRHWPKRPNSANDGRNLEPVYAEVRPKYTVSRSECSDNDSDPYHRPHRSRSRDSYWGSDQEFDSWVERPYWSEGADVKNDSYQKRRMNRHKTRPQTNSQSSPFEDDFTQPIERSEASLDSLSAEPRTRVEVELKHSPSPRNSMKDHTKRDPRNYKGSSYFEDDLTPTASASSDTSDRPRLGSDLKATPEELPSDIKDPDSFVSEDSGRDSFFNGEQKFDDDTFTFRSELEDQVPEKSTALPLKNARPNKYGNNKIKGDQYIKKSESVNIFARENDPFDDDEFFN